jgi:hypothetical protein
MPAIKREAEEPGNFLTKGQAGVHTNSKEETTEVISAMPEIPCRRAVSATKGNMKIIITYPTKGDAREAELVKEVQMMMETMIMQQIKENKGDVK